MADADDIDEEVGLLKPGDVLDGRYRIEKELGRGGIGVVYRAFDLELQTFVAIKMLLPKWAKDRKMVARFLREGRLAIRARHAYIVSILAINRQQGTGTPYIVMEFIEGTVLLDRLKAARERGLPIGLAILPIIKQLASVLAACHAQKIVHRDLKPANVMLVQDEHVTGGERVKLVDFGIAKMFSDEEDGTQTSVGDQQPGTPSYMAPEQCSTLEKDADPAKMDVYALGVMAYQGLVGRLPLYSPNRIGMIALLLHSQPEPLLKFDPSLPAELAQLVHDMLSKDPTKRPTMDQVRQRLNSGTEVISVRSTIEINALVPAPASEGSLAQTADEPASTVGSTAPPSHTPIKSIGERSTEPQPAEAMEQSSVGAGTGQQVTGAETRHRHRRRIWLLAGSAALVSCGIAGVAWRVLTPSSVSKPTAANVSAVAPAPSTAPSQPAAVVPAATPPAVPVPPPAAPVAEKDALSASPETRHAKSKPICVEPMDSCITGKVTAAQRGAILTSLREAKIKLCPSDSLRVSPDYDIVAIGVRKNKQEDFQNLLRGYLRSAKLQGQVEIKCPAK